MDSVQKQRSFIQPGQDSIIHEKTLQREVAKALGISPEETSVPASQHPLSNLDQSERFILRAKRLVRAREFLRQLMSRLKKWKQ